MDKFILEQFSYTKGEFGGTYFGINGKDNYAHSESDGYVEEKFNGRGHSSDSYSAELFLVGTVYLELQDEIIEYQFKNDVKRFIKDKFRRKNLGCDFVGKLNSVLPLEITPEILFDAKQYAKEQDTIKIPRFVWDEFFKKIAKETDLKHKSHIRKIKERKDE